MRRTEQRGRQKKPREGASGAFEKLFGDCGHPLAGGPQHIHRRELWRERSTGVSFDDDLAQDQKRMSACGVLFQAA
jgi:hypothetical protein